jgi:hypothetical protein
VTRHLGHLFVEVLTALTVAVCDGLAMQHLADPEFDLDPVFALYATIVNDALDRLRREAGER